MQTLPSVKSRPIFNAIALLWSLGPSGFFDPDDYVTAYAAMNADKAAQENWVSYISGGFVASGDAKPGAPISPGFFGDGATF